MACVLNRCCPIPLPLLFLLPAVIFAAGLLQLHWSRLNMRRQRYGTLEKLLDIQNEMCAALIKTRHDSEKSRLYLEKSLKKGKYAEAASYLEKREFEAGCRIPVLSGVQSLDCLLMWYRKRLLQCGHTFTVTCELLRLPLQETEFCVMICNLLDYVLRECARKQTASTKVHLELRRQGDMLFLALTCGPFERFTGSSRWKRVRTAEHLRARTWICGRIVRRRGGNMRCLVSDGVQHISIVFWQTSAAQISL